MSRGTGPLVRGAQSAEPVDQDGVVREGGLGVEQRVELLVVAGDAQVERSPDGLGFGAVVGEAASLEVKEGPLVVGEVLHVGDGDPVRRVRSAVAADVVLMQTSEQRGEPLLRHGEGP